MLQSEPPRLASYLAKLKGKDSGCNSKRRTTESGTHEKIIDNGNNPTLAHVCSITGFHSGPTGNANNWEQHFKNPARIFTASIHPNTPTLAGMSCVSGIFPNDTTGVDSESSSATLGLSVPFFAVSVTVIMRVGDEY